MKKIKFILPAAIITAFTIFGCSDLDESFNDRLTLEQVEAVTGSGGTVDISGLLSEAYKKTRQIQSQDLMFAAFEHTGDAVMGPTRGGDWDDNGIWRSLHQQTWDADHSFIGNEFKELTSGLFAALDILQFKPNAQQEAEARYLRALHVFWICDGWGQVPMREPGASLSDLPTVLTSVEAINYVISELEAIKGNLPANDDPWVATQAAADALLAKAYLNKAVFESEDRLTFTFPAGDMDKVIQHCDAIISTGKYALEENYYDNFTSDNDHSSEMIFSSQNIGGIEAGNVRGRWMMGLHYNQTPSGWNGFTTLADFYNKFEDGDQRKSKELPLLKEQTGLMAGFLIGQQYDKDGNALKDRQGNPLSFTLESPIIVSGDLLEVSGVRGIKYIPNMDMESTPDNDYAIFRLGDILLMKAEALMRKGDNNAALAIVNQLRSVRGASALGSINENTMLDERGRELWWENWRRNDLVRFGKYLNAWTEKPNASDPKYLLFPFPSSQIVANPSLVQNPGY